MTSPAGELSFQTRSQPFVQDQMAVICLVEVASCPSREDGPLGSAWGTGRAADVPGGRRAGLDRRGLVARSLCFSNSRALEMQLHNTVMMGTWAQGYWCLCPSFLCLRCSGGNSQVQRALTWRLDGLDSASVLSCKAFGFSFLLCRSGEGKKSQFCYPTEMYWD